MTKRKLRYSGLGLAVLTVGAIAACSSDNTGGGGGGGGTGPKGGSSSGGSAGTIAAAGNTATGGSNAAGTGTGGSATAGTGAGGSPGFACANTMPMCALITDGTNLLPHPTMAGNFAMSGAVEGGTYSYAPNALTLDSLSKTALNVKGNVKAYDGVGIYFNTCYNVKTLNYTGVSFSIKGNAGPTGSVNFRVQTNSNTAYNDPINATAKKGLCLATDPNNAYPDCHAAGKDIPVTSTATVQTVNFADLTGGLPTAGVDGSDIVGLEWALAWKEGGFGTGGTGAGGAASGGSGGASGGSAGKGGSTAAGGSATGGTGTGGAAPSDGSYNVDITIDDVKFLGGPATATCTTGTGGSGAGGGSTGGSSSGGGSATAGSSSGGASGGTGGASGGAGGKAGSGG